MADWGQRMKVVGLAVNIGTRVVPVVLDVLDEHEGKSDQEKAEIVAEKVGEEHTGLRQVSRQTIALFSAALISLVGDLTPGRRP